MGEQVRWVEKGQSPLCKIGLVGATIIYHTHVHEDIMVNAPIRGFKPISRATAILKYGFDIEKEGYV